MVGDSHAARKEGDDIVVSVGGEVGMELHCDAFVNCGGLSASKLAEAVHVGLPTPPESRCGNFDIVVDYFSRIISTIPPHTQGVVCSTCRPCLSDAG